MNSLLKRKNRIFRIEQGVFYLLAISVFLPYIFSFVLDAIIAAIVLCRKDSWKKLIGFSGTKYVVPFALFGTFAAVMHKNYLGLAVLMGLVIVMFLFQYLRAVATRAIIERTFDLCCALSFVSVFVALIEFVLLKLGVISGKFSVRCSSFYYNPNFFATVMTFVAIICVYKILSKKGFNVFYYISLLVNVLGMALSGSMFAFVELGVALFFLILFAKRYKLLALYVCVIFFFGSLFFLIPELLPRFSEISKTITIRIDIWRIVFGVIKDNPLLGVGFFAYGKFVSVYAPLVGVTNPWPAFYAHNLLLESVSATGILGTAIFICYLLCILKEFLKLHPRARSRNLASLPIAISIGVIVHGMVDITVLWIQPAMLFVLILASLGALEKMKIVE